MNHFNIERAFEMKRERLWDTLYWCIDFHDTLFKGKYDNEQDIELYPYAREVLQYLSSREDCKLIAFSSTPFPVMMVIIMKLREHYNIRFDYVNRNPDVASGGYADFSKKFYYNILLDDKAGFEAEDDWLLVKNVLIRIGEWKK